MEELDYTDFAKKGMSDYETSIFNNKVLDVYQLMKNKQLTIEDVLWYHAFEGFTYLCSMPRKNEQIAAEIRRFLFREKLNGWEEQFSSQDSLMGKNEKAVRYCLPDNSCYDSLTSPELLSKMTQVLKECYRKCNLTKDEGIADNISQTPASLKKFLLQEVTNRDSLLRLAFVLQLGKEDFNRFLTSGSYSRNLNAVVPRELILLYCIENGNYDWEFVNKLQKAANKYKNEYCQGDSFKEEAELFNTKLAKDRWEMNLQGMSKEIFKEEILRPCCHIAVLKSSIQEKSGKDVQYSNCAFEKIRQNSILRDLEKGMDNCNCYEGYYTVFLTDTVQRYMEEFNLPQDYRIYKKTDEDKNIRNKIMSKDSYCRFLSYRMMMPNLPKVHRVKFYRMKYGLLPDDIRKNVLKVTDIDELHETEGRLAKPQNIKRSDILVTTFYSFLMEKWSSGTPFVAESQKVAHKLWIQFLKRANTDLKDVGYPIISSKNPMDAMLRICLQSLAPLECYNRIYELNILCSLAHDSEGYSEKNYPKLDRIWLVLDGLRESGRKISKLCDSSEFNFERLNAFCSEVESCLQK